MLHAWDMTHSFVGHDSFMYGTWLIHVWGMTHSWHMTHSWDMTHSCMGHDSFMCETCRQRTPNILHTPQKSPDNTLYSRKRALKIRTLQPKSLIPLPSRYRFCFSSSSFSSSSTASVLPFSTPPCHQPYCSKIRCINCRNNWASCCGSRDGCSSCCNDSCSGCGGRRAVRITDPVCLFACASGRWWCLKPTRKCRGGKDRNELWVQGVSVCLCKQTVMVTDIGQNVGRRIRTTHKHLFSHILAAGKIGDSPIKSDMKLGPKCTSVLSPSLKGPYNWSQNRGKWWSLFHGAVEEHEKECPWQLGALSEYVECEEG